MFGLFQVGLGHLQKLAGLNGILQLFVNQPQIFFVGQSRKNPSVTTRTTNCL